MTAETEVRYFPAHTLVDFSTAVFKYFGVSQADAELAAGVLAKSDLRGIDSHGVARLHTYFEMLELDRINPKPKIKIVREKASVATVDGDNGLGLVVGPKANDIAMDKAEQHGSGWVSVCNTNHFGIAGYYPLKALERDLIGWAMTNSTKLVAPLWGAERMLGTNPIAIAFPGYKEPPIVIDMATSAVAYGKIEIALRKKEPVPKGWIVDKRGDDTTNPQAMIDGGAQLPLGYEREMGGHKGYGLASMVDILCCVLSGANWGPFAPPFALRQEIPERSVGKGIGHFFGAMQIDGFIDKDEFKKQIDDWIQVFRNSKPAPGTNGPLSPGTRKEKRKLLEARKEFRY
ncbi:MAG TPA: Ldh family oxidoreductase [Acidobacteriota bacterium]|nr:Ldh family oxidoreductase [Acidobacteriota bacterium]